MKKVDLYINVNKVKELIYKEHADAFRIYMLFNSSLYKITNLVEVIKNGFIYKFDKITVIYLE